MVPNPPYWVDPRAAARVRAWPGAAERSCGYAGQGARGGRMRAVTADRVARGRPARTDAIDGR